MPDCAPRADGARGNRARVVFANLASDDVQQLGLAALKVGIDPLAGTRLAEGVVVERAHPRRVLRVPEEPRQHVLSQPLRVVDNNLSAISAPAAVSKATIDHLPGGADELARPVQRRTSHLV